MLPTTISSSFQVNVAPHFGNEPLSSATLHVRRTKNPKRLSTGVSPVCEFPAFLPEQVENIKDPSARNLASRIERLPVRVGFLDSCIMTSCVKPREDSKRSPVLLLHGFDSSCLEWRYTLPLLEEAGLETWAIDVLGWGFSDLKRLPPCDVASKRDHLHRVMAFLFIRALVFCWWI